MKTCRIKDNTEVKGEEDLSDIPNLIDKIKDKNLKELRDSGDVFVFPELTDKELEEKKVLERGRNGLKATNMMGFIGYGDERLIIESRFSPKGKDYFVQYLLYRVLDFPLLVGLEWDAGQNDQLFDWLLFLFPSYLKKAIRKGLFKTYVRKHYNDGNVRGTIDIARHIKMNTPFIGNIAYSQREFSYDNNLMELVRHTIEFIKRKPCGSALLNSRAKDEVKMVVEATQAYKRHDRRRIIQVNKKSPVRHAYFREYLELQRLCLLILQHQKHSIESGSRQLYGVLFDGASLWEEYVYSLIGDYFHHPNNRNKTGEQHLFTQFTEDPSCKGKKKGRIYPDFISTNSKNRIIADAKYKPVGNIGSEDYQQVLAYMFRFDAKTGYYLYPFSPKEKGNGDDEVLWMNKGSTYEDNVEPRDDIRVVKRALKICDDAQNYEDFVNQMKSNEEDFIEKFNLNSAVVN